MSARFEIVASVLVSACFEMPMPSAPMLSVTGLKYCCSATMLASVVASVMVTKLDALIWLHNPNTAMNAAAELFTDGSCELSVLPPRATTYTRGSDEEGQEYIF